MSKQTPPKSETKPIPKIATGISGLDAVLQGGLPANRTTLIKGAAGTGKTVMGLEFLYRSALQGEPAIFISFEESAEAVRQNALAAGWNIAALETANKLFLWEAKIDRSAVISGEFGLDSLLAIIRGKAEQMGARRVMFDAIDVLMRVFEDPVKERNELYRLHDWLAERQFTTIVTAKVSRQTEPGYRYEFLDYMTDCVVLLDLRVNNQVATRRLRVIKYRGSGFQSNEFPYLITAEGNVILPISSMFLSHRPLGEKISSGNPDFDAALGGGYHRASCILISGPSGCGKTTLAATFAEKACARGGKVLYISFEESQAAIVAAMRSPGIDLQPAIDENRLRFFTVLPEAFGPEEHLYRILQHIDQFRPDHLVVDAISAGTRMGAEEAAFDFLVRLIHICKAREITNLMTSQVAAHKSQASVNGFDIASIVDTLISIRFVEIGRLIQRDLVIVKSRGVHHSNRHHLYSITDTGVHLAPLAAETGGG